MTEGGPQDLHTKILSYLNRVTRHIAATSRRGGGVASVKAFIKETLLHLNIMKEQWGQMGQVFEDVRKFWKKKSWYVRIPSTLFFQARFLLDARAAELRTTLDYHNLLREGGGNPSAGDLQALVGDLQDTASKALGYNIYMER